MSVINKVADWVVDKAIGCAVNEIGNKIKESKQNEENVMSDANTELNAQPAEAPKVEAQPAPTVPVPADNAEQTNPTLSDVASTAEAGLEDAGVKIPADVQSKIDFAIKVLNMIGTAVPAKDSAEEKLFIKALYGFAKLEEEGIKVEQDVKSFIKGL